MKRKSKIKLIASLGVTTVLSAPIGLIVTQTNKSLNNKTKTALSANDVNNDVDQSKMDNITKEQLLTLYNITVGNTTTASSQVLKLVNKDNATLNNLSGLSIKITNTFADDKRGEIVLTATISKASLQSKVFENITIDGFQQNVPTDQQKLDAITGEQINLAMELDFSGTVLASVDVAKIKTLSNTEIGGLDGVTITVSNQAASDTTGTITYDATISKGSLTDKVLTGITMDGYLIKGVGRVSAVESMSDLMIDSTHTFSQMIDSTHAFVGTSEEGLYIATYNADGDATKATQVPMTGSNSVPDVQNGWIQKVDLTHFLVGTKEEGVYQVTVSADGSSVTEATQVAKTGANSLPDATYGWCQRIGTSNNYLIGTTEDGVYQVTLDANGAVKTTTQVSTDPKANLYIPNVAAGWIQRIDDTHYLLGTDANGVFKITVNATTGVVTASAQIPMKGDNSIPSVANGWSIQIDATHYLIGTAYDGVYQVTTNASGDIQTSVQVSTNLIDSATNGWAQKVDATHYLIGSSAGIYQVTVDSNGLITKADLSTFPINSDHGWILQLSPLTYWVASVAYGVKKVELFDITP